jgi:hypothetical protein
MFMANQKSGTEKSQLTLFKDDRQEDWAAILVSIVVVLIIVIMTMK